MVDSKEKMFIETENVGQESVVRNTEVKTGLVDVEARAHVPEDVKSWLEKIEIDSSQMKTVNDPAGQPLLQLTAPQDPRVQLPTTRKSFLEGFTKKIDEAGKWLSTFLLRVIKMNGGKVKFKEG